MKQENLDILNELRNHKENHFQMIKALGEMGAAIKDIQKMVIQVTQTQDKENIVLKLYPETFRSNGFLYNSIFIGDAAVTDGAKLVIGGDIPTYTVTLTAGENRLDMPDGCTYYVTTTSNNPVTALLTRYNNAR